jgi:NAD(P)-dependent dehydrogenase (short-subunit alcohol dehydrogenase family)
MTNKTWLITGASSGLGHTPAEHVLAQGDHAVVTAQSVEDGEKRTRRSGRTRPLT